MLLHIQRFIILQMTQLCYFTNSMKDVNRKVNYDLRYIFEWLRINKISLNSGETELILFRSKNKIKIITKNMNFRISGQKINIICKRKYLTTLKYHLENLKLKLNRASCFLSKIKILYSIPVTKNHIHMLFLILT